MNKPRSFNSPSFVFWIVCIFASLSPVHALARSIRSVKVDDSSVTLIHTAIGYSTILEFESKPISAVLGDQDSFRLEYVGKSITIKPLVPHAKSNLFIFTDYDRFNCQIVSGPQAQVDYLVRIQAQVKSYPVESGNGATPATRENQEVVQFVTRPIHRFVTYDGFRLAVESLARERDLSKPRSVTLIDFALSSEKLPYSFQALSLGVKQGGRFLDLESLYLEGLELVPGAPPIQGKIALLSRDFKARLPVTLVFAVPKRNEPKSVHRIEVSSRPADKKAKTEAIGKTGKIYEKGQ